MNSAKKMNDLHRKISDYIDERFVLTDPDMEDLRNRCEAAYIPVIWRETESFLKVYLSALKPRRILEIGTAYGYSAILFAKLLPDAHVTTVEREPDVWETAEEEIRRFGLKDRIDVLCGDAETVLRDLDPVEPYDFVFIDAGKSHYSVYLDEVTDLCSDDAVILCDNILLNGMLVDPSLDPRGKHRTNIRRMKDFIDSVTCDSRFDVTLLRSGDGLAVIRKVNHD